MDERSRSQRAWFHDETRFTSTGGTIINTPSKTCLISRNPEVAYAQIDQEMVMLEPEKAVFCTVNPMGTVLWTLLENTALSLNVLCNHIHQHYEVTEAQCVEDVTQFINEMVALNVLMVSNDL